MIAKKEIKSTCVLQAGETYATSRQSIELGSGVDAVVIHVNDNTKVVFVTWQNSRGASAETARLFRKISAQLRKHYVELLRNYPIIIFATLIALS